MISPRRQKRSPELKWFAAMVERSLADTLPLQERLLACFRAWEFISFLWFLLFGWYLVLFLFWSRLYFVAASADRFFIGERSRWSGRPKKLTFEGGFEGVALKLVRKGIIWDRFKLDVPGRRVALQLRIHRTFRNEVETFGLMLEASASARSRRAGL